MVKTILHPQYRDPREEFNEKHVTWVIDKSLLGGTFSEKLPDIVLNNGYKLITLDGNPRTYDLLDLPGGYRDEGSGPIIAYGTQRFIKEVHRMPWFPGGYPQSGQELENLYPTNYMTKYPSEYLFNKNYIFVPIVEAIRNSDFFFKIFESDHLFIKDISAFKRFNAKVVDKKELIRYLSLYKDVEYIEDNNWVMISSPKEIKSEHRFVIVKSNVIAHSTYRYNNILDIRIDVPKEALDFANAVAKIWVPGNCFTLDIAMTENGPKILELNSFSCAGLYACDLDKVVVEISKQAREDFFLSAYPD